MQVVEEYNNKFFEFIKHRITKMGWKVVSMVSYPYNIYDYGSSVQNSVIVVYEAPDKQNEKPE